MCLSACSACLIAYTPDIVDFSSFFRVDFGLFVSFQVIFPAAAFGTALWTLLRTDGFGKVSMTEVRPDRGRTAPSPRAGDLV